MKRYIYDCSIIDGSLAGPLIIIECDCGNKLQTSIHIIPINKHPCPACGKILHICESCICCPKYIKISDSEEFKKIWNG